MEHVRKLRQDDADGHPAESYEQEGIDVIFGSGSFVDSHRFQIDDRVISSRKFVICTGSHPFIPSIEGIDGIEFLTNETVFELVELPKSLIILGAGPIGAEMCCALNRLGVEVTVVVRGKHILSREDEEMSDALMDLLKGEGVKFLIEHQIVRFGQVDGGVSATVKATSGQTYEISAESVLIAVGRRSTLEGLALDKAGVEYNSKGVVVDKHLRTTAKNIYAAGDVVPPYLFTHIAEYEAVIATTNACLPIPVKKAAYSNVPWCTFTAPEFARVGLTEAEARKTKHGKKVRVYKWNNSDVDRAKTDLATDGFSKFVCDTKGRILGVHILGSSAAELMHEVQLARSRKIPFHKIASVIHAYPSYSDSVRQPAKKCYIDILQNNFFVKILGAITAKRNRKRVIIFGIVALLFLILQSSGLGDLLSLKNIQAHGARLQAFSDSHYLTSVVSYILLYVLVAAFSIPGAMVLTLAGGFLYGFVVAALYVNVGATTGAIGAFLFARYIAGKWLQQKYASQLVNFNTELHRNGANYLLVLRFIFVFPFFLINLMAGLTRVRLRTFIWTTSLGILPGSLIYAFTGQQLGDISHITDIFSGKVLLAFILLAGFALTPVIIDKAKKLSNKSEA
jgi:pyruvate/2-oxoglutarate dehydrogenase complex dihydrolipoamide dehydrogenase (E3) component/uncharacterized membrane protein YdjX (TVP38/TMEM64 family)